MRGERRARLGLRLLQGGSSPHARGTHVHPHVRGAESRIIPACAGNASSGQVHHPRMRGERLVEMRASCADFGSSPHARGTPAARPPARARRRIIPACAGNAVSLAHGSSPHARGTRRWLAPLRPDRRIIPACAGNAPVQSSQRASVADHPRMRGERQPTTQPESKHNGSSPHARGTPPRAGRTVASSGSSPHARGTPLTGRDVVDRNRIIPACAGNAPADVRNIRPEPDHPRMRGERWLGGVGLRFVCGSSPHARGTPSRSPWRRRCRRIIPACAGNASPRQR